MSTTDRKDDLDAKTDTGPGPGRGVTAHATEEAEFDREINVRGIVLSGVALIAVAVVTHLLMWGLLHGFSSYDEKRDVRLTPIEAASPQPPPPEPRLQISPQEDMRLMRAQEDQALQNAGWVNQQQGAVRVPVDVAIDVIAARGVAPQVVGGTASSMNPDQTRMQIGGTPADVRKPGATVQNALPAAPAPPPQ
ncbi:MAG TPA: hypothetical protein VHC97_25705 [Thermoanaerobaculia bacterium]|jgi:hypothetical protein|nr:hypothetical protein [Thermoanaerobaculia bacterium]